ncbi:MAG TPA: bifunctional metallophosphatase/5'-nucleotidase, partial [Sphingomicrobium sp.]|nr:bifunctional metallophosphatase/5'-nucleotidase [Sphingomicrobium sp.]
MRQLRLIPLFAFLAACTTTPQPVATAPVQLQILAINDFHGNIEPPKSPIELNGQQVRVGGAAHIAAKLAELRQVGLPTVTVSAGDLIGASPLASAYYLDEPTILAMNQLGLDLNAVGNHEFDRGSEELKRMQNGGCEKHGTRQPCAVDAAFPGARFRFLAANVRDGSGQTLLPGTAIRQMGGVKVGFVGMTLKETATLVSPAGVRGLTFTDEVATANEAAQALKAQGADTLVLLMHQGARVKPTYNVSGCPGLEGEILPIFDRIDPAYSLVVSGHTHFAYACELPTSGGGKRLLTSAGRYGYLVTDIRLQLDPETKSVTGWSANNVPVTRDRSDAAVKQIVDRYIAAAAPAAARVVGTLAGPALNNEFDDESPAANLIADAQLAATRSLGAQAGFMNGGGVRTGLTPDAQGRITFGQIFDLQPFGNGLVVVELTGEQLGRLLEQQFTDDSYAPGARSRLLVPSANFAFDYDLSKPNGQRIVTMSLDGKPIDRAKNYRIAVNNFLASGGDGYSVLTEGKA